MAKKEKTQSKNRNIPDIIPEEITIKIPSRMQDYARGSIYMNLMRAQNANARVLELTSDYGRTFSDVTLQMDRAGAFAQRIEKNNMKKSIRMKMALQEFIISTQDRLNSLCKEYGFDNKESESVKKARANRFTEEDLKEVEEEFKVAKGA